MKFTSSLAAASVLASVLASPIALTETSPLAKRAVDAALFAKLKFYVQYAAAAYCTNNADSSGTPISCATGNCPDVQAANAVSVLEFDSSILTDMRGFLSVSTVRQEIVLAFRGSSSIRNFLTDLNFGYVNFGCSGCSAHAGFATAWYEPRSAILAALKTTRAQYPSYKIVITGHSLGGAVATLAAGDLRSQGYAADLYTYGSPRVGNGAFASWVSAQPGVTARVTHVNDPVPRLPPMLIAGYRHTTPEYWLSNGSATKVDYTLADVKVCEGISTTGCNAGTIPTLDLDAHRYYFLAATSCAPDLAFKREEQMSPARRADGSASDVEILSWMAADAAASPSELAATT
ncbi:hypothetical protein V499_08225 [Pseudogymnoascus sp. VKM F-103]|uniref:Fungal lipase-like domain-containing protein n=1 Tax=Pseudogymnoascus verrucosus TaxID=342668 RepID=A0A2P2SXA5_9PEZI|nr:uncharacterized protein VE01_00466 [Pseudogymnoascus verrucosus]KFY71565.1 hypothetical protein V499_08225 [Pseudogymnoascus sp. VKM F-103]OBU01498.1 hypothetical protein VE01_00466 [Pseudogymnoascus verrucosus]